jgi:purine catabolism regulator
MLDTVSGFRQAGGVAFRIADLLDLPPLAAAGPDLLHGDAERTVRWVHSSEIFDIGPLLKGGEALLTSGLGLVGASSAQVRTYARSLIETDLSALIFEVGRTFAAVPHELEDELRSSRVALVRLPGVVPFIEITEAAHRRILDAESNALRAAERTTSRLTDVLIAGGGPSALLRELSALVDAPVVYDDPEGRMVVSAGEVPDAARELDCAVQVRGEHRGLLRSSAPVTPENRAIIERGAQALALELARSGANLPTRRYAHEELLAGIRDGSIDALERRDRARALGLAVRGGQRLVAIAGLRAPGRSVDEVYVHTADLLPRRVGAAVVGRVSDTVTALVAVDQDALLDLRSLLSSTLLSAPSPLRALCVGTPVEDWARAEQSLAAALEAVPLAGLIAERGGAVLLAEDTALARLLAAADRHGLLEDFVESQLGAVLDYDARRATQLLPSLRAVARAGGNRSAAAAELGVRRQTLYDRMARIESLLGEGSLSDPARMLAIEVATLGWAVATRSLSQTPGAPRASRARPDQPASSRQYAR